MFFFYITTKSILVNQLPVFLNLDEHYWWPNTPSSGWTTNWKKLPLF